MEPHRDRLQGFAVVFLFLAGLVDTSHVQAQDAPAGLVEKQVKSLGKIAPDASEFVPSPNGQRLAYIFGKQGERQQVVCDGKPGASYQVVYREYIRFSADGQRLGYVATRLANRNIDTTVFVCDGVENPTSPNTLPFAFSPDGKHLAYTARSPSGQCSLMVDGKPQKFRLYRGVAKPVFSPDSKHLIYSSDTGGNGFVVYDGKKGPEFQDIGDAAFSPDGRLVAYAVCDGGVWGMICGNSRQGPYAEVGKPVFSPDSVRLAFRARLQKAWFIVCGKDVGPPFEQVGEPVFSIGGGRLAYTAAHGINWSVVCDGKKGPDYAQVGEPVFSPDGKHVAYHATREGKTLVVCDGKESTPYAETTWIGFSPDSTHLAFAAGGQGKRLIVCDGLESPAHENVLVPEHFYDVPGKFRYVVIDRAGAEKEASLVEVDWPEGRTWEDAFKAKAP